MDLSDIGGNMMHGAHIAAIGGTFWRLFMALQACATIIGRPSFRPSLPEEWSRLAFSLVIRGQLPQVDIDHAPQPTACLRARD